LINARDGGINGVKVAWEECETKYDTKLGVECYEKLKGQGAAGAALINPYSTGITYQLIPKAPVDKIPIHSMGYGRTASADGRVFEWAFNFPTTYWSQASAFIKYVGEQEGGLDKLKGKKIALVYHNSPYGKEPIPTLEVLAKQHGYDLNLLAVDHPGQEQKATWLQIRRYQPDWIFLWGWGVMNQVAVKEASATPWITLSVCGGLEVNRTWCRREKVRRAIKLAISTASAPTLPCIKRCSSMSTTAMKMPPKPTTSVRCSTTAG
jgi:branched-chain amino acid transport system substrate-binding protein